MCRLLSRCFSSKLSIIVIVAIWRIFLTVISYLAISLLPFKPTFPYATELLPNFGSRLLTTWAQFDGVHYLLIIEHGYHMAALTQTFFPAYPLLVKLLTLGEFNPVMIGLAISTLSFSFGLYYLRKLLLLDEPEITVNKSLLLILVAPTAFFFTSLYTEGLFFLLVVLSYYFARSGRWWQAGLCGALASATRLVGIFLIPALIYEYWVQQKSKKSIQVLATMIPTLGLGSYMYYLYNEFRDPLYFFHAQASFGTARETNRIILLYQVVFRYLKMLVSVPITSRGFYIISQEFGAGILGILVSIAGWFTIRKSYVIFMALAYILPTLTGTFSSLPRYLLPLFPVYLVAAKFFPHRLYILVAVASVVTLVINLILFTQGLWVA